MHSPIRYDLEMLFTRYQDPRQPNAIMRVKQEIHEGRMALQIAIESVLDRRVRLGGLIELSKDCILDDHQGASRHIFVYYFIPAVGWGYRG